MEHPDHRAAGPVSPAPAAAGHLHPPDVDERAQPAEATTHEYSDQPSHLDQPDELDEAGVAEVPEPPDTGDQIVDQATAGLAQAMHEPLELQVQAFERAHRTLQDRLADVES